MILTTAASECYERNLMFLYITTAFQIHSSLIRLGQQDEYP